jgi:LMBR1 domain-containing protein 1
MKRNDQLKENTTNSEEKSHNLKSRQTGKKKLKPLQNTIDYDLNTKQKKTKDEDKNDQTINSIKNNNSNPTKKEYFNKLGLERINFQFDEYGEYPDDDFQPSIFFFKFLANKPDYEKENSEKGKKATSKLKLYVPDTIVLNDLDSNYWIYTDIEGNVNRIEETDADVIEKFKSNDKDENELIGVSKMPISKDGRVDENRLDLLNLDELEKCLFSKSGSQIAIQRFIKCRGPKAFVCRSVWRRNKPAYIYILTNKANFHDNVKNQNLKYVVNSREPSSYFAFYSTSGKHLEETMYYMNNIVKFIEGHSDIEFSELAGDFVKDEAGIWWFINLKAMKIKNIDKFKPDAYGNCTPPQLDFFINRRGSMGYQRGVMRKFDYQTKIRCKLCGIDYSKQKLKYKLTTKMILETDKMLKHVQFDKSKFNVIDRADLKHTDYSMIYLPYRVCEDCYLLFETLNDIKNYQIEIANIFRNPVDKVNFGFNFYQKEKPKTGKIELSNDEMKEIDKIKEDVEYMENNDLTEEQYRQIINQDSNESNKNNQKDLIESQHEEKPNNLYRIMVMFNDLIWSDKIKIPEKDLFLVYSFLGGNYKVPIKIEKYTQDIDYSIINFMKIYHIICTEPEGFIDYVEKNRHMEIKLGYFEVSEEETKKKDVRKLLKKQIIIEDQDLIDESENFIQIASVDLSLQGLKYGANYRNMLNGLLFKRDEPHYVGKLRCLIRIHKVKEIKDLSKYTLHNHFNFLIPPVNFVVSDEMPDYWIDLVERQKLREICLNEIMSTLEKNKFKYNKERDKKGVLQALEGLISYYATNSL